MTHRFRMTSIANILLFFQWNGKWDSCLAKCCQITAIALLAFTSGKFHQNFRSFGVIWSQKQTSKGQMKKLCASKIGQAVDMRRFFPPVLLESEKVVSAIFSIFYGIVAFEKEVFDQWFDFEHLVAFERHAAYLMAGFICLFVISSIVGCMGLLGE